MRVPILRVVLTIALVLPNGCSAERSDNKRDRTVLLVPIGPVSADLLVHLQQELPSRLGREVRIGNMVAVPPVALDTARQQYLGVALLEELARYEGTADRVVGIIEADVYAPGLNFIYGQASKPGRFAIIALPRLRESFRGRSEDPVRFRERLLKVTIHELGHTFGLTHCTSEKCVMHFANALGDVDRQGVEFCSEEQLPK